jgi:hypothetical protein
MAMRVKGWFTHYRAAHGAVVDGVVELLERWCFSKQRGGGAAKLTES